MHSIVLKDPAVFDGFIYFCRPRSADSPVRLRNWEVSCLGYFLSFLSSAFSKARNKFVILPTSGKEVNILELDA